MHLRCWLSPSDLRSYFANEMKRGTYGFNIFRLSPSWAVYCVKHVVNVLLQILLHCVPSCEKNLVEEQIMFGFSFSVKWNLAHLSGTFRVIIVNGNRNTLW